MPAFVEREDDLVELLGGRPCAGGRLLDGQDLLLVRVQRQGLNERRQLVHGVWAACGRDTGGGLGQLPCTGVLGA